MVQECRDLEVKRAASDQELRELKDQLGRTRQVCGQREESIH